MYFPVGWPTLLKSNGTTSGGPVKLLRTRKSYMIELRERSVAFWHSRLQILVSSYVRSVECVEEHGTNASVAIKHDGSILVIATSKDHLIFLKINYKLFSPDKQTRYSTKGHGIQLHQGSQYEASGEGRDLESVSVKYLTSSVVVGGLTRLVNMGSHLLVATSHGMLHRVDWEGIFDSDLLINLSNVPFANDLLPESRGTSLGESGLYPLDLVHSPDMHGFSLVLSDGRGAFLTSHSSRYDPQDVHGVWIPGLTGAVCTAINGRYRIAAFGKEDGSVEVYSMDDSNGLWSISHTLKLSRSQFPETSVQLGCVRSMEWSIGDGMVIAVAWTNGGLSLWTVFGSLLLCSLGDQPGTPSPLNPHCTVLDSMCWSSDGYHLWMLPRAINNNRDFPMNHEEGLKSTQTRRSVVDCRDSSDHVIVMRFMRNAIVDNPISDNHDHLFLLGSDRLYLNLCKSVIPSVGVASHKPTPSGSSFVSSPSWKVIQYPSSYLVLNWPIKYAALNSTGMNLVVSGRAGFAIYSGKRRKWKLFGNEVQEQSLTCRGGLLWFEDVVVFPCQVQKRNEEVRFYSLHSNLDNSQLLQTLKSTSPIVRINLHGNHLLLASRDCHMTILGLNTSLVPNKGMTLSVSKLHEVSLAGSLSHPWASTLISIVPSSIRTEPTTAHPHAHVPSTSPPLSMHSILFNVGGKVLMIQQEIHDFPSKEQIDSKFFSSPVCLAGSVEALWTPPYHCTSDKQTGQHLMESLWLACGASGIKVWLPLYPRDEGHPTFLSKRIMLTLPITVYPQAVLFSDAIMFGLSHETAFTDAVQFNRHCFPFATIERTTHVFLHHVMRQLLRRNLGSHALQIARNSSHLPYFRHVLELMLHEILEEEAPRSRSMPVPDALLPCVVEFIKQFPEFLDTIGHCARKTEIALWQYLFAAVGNPRDLFELSLSDGSLNTAATYLIIIQNLEAASVSRQLATRLLDAALDSNWWELCKDLVRFLKAIGPGDTIDSPLITIAMTPNKTPTPTQPVTAALDEDMTPDLDRSAMSITRDYLTSGNSSSMVSLSGDYKDASGKVIKRPQFVMDVDSKEDYFIELILCRHARKLLTSYSLRDLGYFTAHLGFNLRTWLTKERVRAARVDDFVSTLREVHKVFQWPFPVIHNETSVNDTLSPTSTIQGRSPKDTPNNSAPLTPVKATLGILAREAPGLDSGNEAEGMTSSLKRPNRPPDLNLTPAHTVAIMRTTAQGTQRYNISLNSSNNITTGNQSCTDAVRSSTPSKRSGSLSERVSLVMKPNASSADFNAECSSIGDILEESDWELNSEVAMSAEKDKITTRGSIETEKEIRYFADIMVASQCIEWSMILAVVLLDATLVGRIVEGVNDHQNGGWLVDKSMITRTVQGYKELCCWAEDECPSYLQFLDSLHHYYNQLVLASEHLERQHSPKTPASTQLVSPLISMNIHDDTLLEEGSNIQTDKLISSPVKSGRDSESGCVIS